MELLNKIYIGKLIDIYGGLLTPKQLSAVSGYFLQDLSLTEIAENEGISRQGAYDLVTKSKQALEKFEEIVGKYALEKEIAVNLHILQEKAKSEEELSVINKILSNLE